MQILGIRHPSSAADIADAYKDMVKVWHPDRFENEGKLRQKAEENFKTVQQAFRELKEHGEHARDEKPTQAEPVHEQVTRVHFSLTPEYSLRLFSPLIDGKRVIHVSQMSLSERMVVGEKFKRNHSSVRMMVGAYLFTDSEIVGRGWLTKLAVPLITLPNWEFSLRVIRVPDFTDRFAAKIVGDSENLELVGTCKDFNESLSFSMYDRKLEKLLELLNELSHAIANG